MVALQLAIFGSIWLVVARLKHDMKVPMVLMGLFNGALALNLLLVGMRGHIPEALSRTPANVLGLVAFVALWYGALRLVGVSPPRKEPLWVLAAGTAAIVLLGFSPSLGTHRVAAEFFALVWLILRAWYLARIPLAKVHGRGVSWLLTAVAWTIALVLLSKALGGLLLGWSIEVHRQQPGSLVLPYLVQALSTLLNSVLAYVVVHNILVQMDDLNRHDALTQLLNRRAFTSELNRCWQLWQRRSAEFAVMCIDIDHFKSVNDRFGHQVGDVALIDVARTMLSQVRPTDVLARTGGEEFVLLVSNQPDASLLQLAQRLRHAVENTVFTPDGAPVKVSLGLARCLASDERADGVVSRADAALYRAKANGRNRVELSAEMQADLPTPADTKVIV